MLGPPHDHSYACRRFVQRELLQTEIKPIRRRARVICPVTRATKAYPGGLVLPCAAPYAVTIFCVSHAGGLTGYFMNFAAKFLLCLTAPVWKKNLHASGLGLPGSNSKMLTCDECHQAVYSPYSVAVCGAAVCSFLLCVSCWHTHRVFHTLRNDTILPGYSAVVEQRFSTT